MKKVNVVTYCDWRSYGSMLQSYGLQYAIKQLGHDGRVIRPDPVPGKKLKPRLPLQGGLGQRVVDLHKLLNHRALDRKYRRSNAFIQEHIPVCYCGSYQAICENPPEGDIYLAGSDQVWQPSRMDPLFFLDFVPRGTARVSYGASMGISVVPEEKKAQMRQYLLDFDRLSVREEDNRQVIAGLTGREVHRHIDPVFLPEQAQWRRLERVYPGMKRPYILVYAIYWDKAVNRELEELRRKTGMDVVVVSNSRRNIYGNKWVYDADPGQFLWLLDHAQMVVTSSFHGAAMSVIFEKPFAAVIDPGSPSRIAGLVEVLGITCANLEDLKAGNCPDYGSVAQRISRERTLGMDYLRNTLGEL